MVTIMVYLKVRIYKNMGHNDMTFLSGRLKVLVSTLFIPLYLAIIFTIKCEKFSR